MFCCSLNTYVKCEVEKNFTAGKRREISCSFFKFRMWRGQSLITDMRWPVSEHPPTLHFSEMYYYTGQQEKISMSNSFLFKSSVPCNNRWRNPFLLKCSTFYKKLFWSSENHQKKLFLKPPNDETVRIFKGMTDLWYVMRVRLSLHMQKSNVCALSYE